MTATILVGDCREVLPTLTVVVPFVPDRMLAPNRGMDKRRKGPHVAALRMAAKGAAMNAGFAGPPLAGPVEVAYHVRWPTGRRRFDLDSVAAMCKPALDGLVDAGVLVNDGQMVLLTVSQSRTTGDGETEITVREAT